ncbi:RNA ligase [Nonomuraea sp. NPDC023979]|uniref:RNA ligase n=1 Tax=Nonomuraea sp. NPDC023979 TaxID=3154796 RepID=UPI0033D7E3C7
MHIGELFDLAHLDERIASGYVRVQAHPTDPLRIYNYTEKTQYERAWDFVTMTCRGLIVDERDRVVARGFPKFFNHSEPSAGELDLSAPVQVTDKLDGSLGLIYPAADGWAVATRGSFASVQAVHATEVLRRRYPAFVPPAGVTVLVEIVYPENRIVCDYGGADDLFLLGGVVTATGWVLGPRDVQSWPGPSAAVFSLGTLADALAMPPREGAEGLVVRYLDTGRMVKIKQDDYVALHKVITGLNARGVWELLGEGKTVAEICEPLPDEFHAFVRTVADELASEQVRVLTEAQKEFRLLLAQSMAGYPIESGLCHCGCGGETPLATSTAKGYRLGEPTRFIPRHTLRPIPMEIDFGSGCWIWTGAKSNNGYGKTRTTTAHRHLYTHLKGVVRDGYDLDHLCRVRVCVNPHHLQETTRSENALRGAKTRLTREQVAMIRSSTVGNTSELARSMGLPVSTVDAVRRGDTWANDDTEVIEKPISREFRAAFARLASTSTLRPWLFNLLDGRDPRPAIWKTLRPSGDLRPITFSEDAA